MSLSAGPVEPETVLSLLRENQRIMLLGMDAERPLSDEEFVERALMLTLDNPTAQEKVEAFSSVMLLGSHGESRTRILERIEKPNVIPSPNQADDSAEQPIKAAKKARVLTAGKWWDSIKSERQWFSEAIRKVIVNSGQARKSLQCDINAGLKDVVAVTRVTWDGQKSLTDIYWFCPDLDAVFAYALMLLLDKGRPVGKALRCCKLEGCGHIYLAYPPPSGGPRSPYCGDDCRQISKKLSGADRQAKYRSRNVSKGKGGKA
jgi:hypothetical protein